MSKRMTTTPRTILAAALAAALWAGTAVGSLESDPAMALSGKDDGTVFGSLTVRGENRVRITFDRPRLSLDLDPHAPAGLQVESVTDVLERTPQDLVGALVDGSAAYRSRHTPRPWLDCYADGRVAGFAPSVSALARWRLEVIDSNGRPVTAFEGEGNPPAEIVWDGRDEAGAPAAVGLTYSFVFEAVDRAGNRRRYVGEGFGLPAYRLAGDDGGDFLLSGRQWQVQERSHLAGHAPYALAAAGFFNLRTGPGDAVVIAATARSWQQAEDLGRRVAAALAPWLQGGGERIRIEAQVSGTAPADGTLRLWSRSGD